MSKQKLTRWFRPNVKPCNIGVYQTKLNRGSDSMSCFQYWDGHRWSMISRYSDRAFEVRHIKSSYQFVEWRGLAYDPSKGEKKC